MPRTTKIKWRDKDQEELKKVVRNYNNKINRIKSKNPDQGKFLPEKMTLKDARQKIATRKDFNTITGDLKKFSEKGAEQLVTVPNGKSFTKYELDLMKEQNQVRNNQRAKRRRELGLSMKDNPNEVRRKNLQPKQINLETSERALSAFNRQLKKEVLDSTQITNYQKYKENYINGLSTRFGKDADKIKEMLDKVDPVDFRDKINSANNNPFLTIGFLYEPQDNTDMIEALEQEWSNALQD